MKLQMLSAAAASLILTVVFTILRCCLSGGVWFSLAITSGTTAYHIIYRIAVGTCVSSMCKSPNPQSLWFRQKSFEPVLYRFLRVMRWKRYMPTYEPNDFDHTLHTWDEIIQTMCRSELVHEIDIPLSFLPLLCVRIFGAFPAFMITSAGAAAFDLLFVIIQRFNRPRVIKLKNRRL